ncbi:MAG: hypothetical protein CM1200mP10_16760 [Candidatus Neomarinimicrobiota bacterium]|nr:MAG: hypothetical protein CM1200mP10_16760 [Candidatus Neomarinimicrobiota bacterium]
MNLNVYQLNGRHIDIVLGFKPIMVIYSTTPIVNELIIMTEPFLNMIQGLYLDPHSFLLPLYLLCWYYFPFGKNWHGTFSIYPLFILLFYYLPQFRIESHQHFPKKKKNIVEDSKKLEVLAQPMAVKDSNTIQNADENYLASSGLVVKPFVPPKEPRDKKPKAISVQRLVVCENINLEQRKPVHIREVFIDTTSKIYCFVGLRNPEQSEDITHVWKFNGEHYATVHMNISVSDYFRCWSYITPREDAVGQWSVAILDDESNVLQEADFTIVPINEP